MGVCVALSGCMCEAKTAGQCGVFTLSRGHADITVPLSSIFMLTPHPMGLGVRWTRGGGKGYVDPTPHGPRRKVDQRRR